jgi:hypothetical protein
MIQRLTLWATLGVLMNALGYDLSSAGFWCVLALFWATDHLARIETIEDFRSSLLDALEQARDELARAQDRIDRLQQDHKDTQ